MEKEIIKKFVPIFFGMISKQTEALNAQIEKDKAQAKYYELAAQKLEFERSCSRAIYEGQKTIEARSGEIHINL